MFFELTSAQIDQFNEDGFVIVDKLIDDETIEALRARYEKLFRGEFETGILPDEVNWQEGESDPSLTRQICNGWKADRTIASVVMRADLGKAIATLGGWPGARVMVDNLLWKPPGTRPLAYHQDNAYLEWFQPTELLSCWMALDDTRADAGTVEFVRGSHRWHHSQPEGEFHGPKEYRKYMEQAAAEEGVEPEIVHVEVPRESLNNPMFAVSRGRGGLDVKLDDIADRPGAALVTGYGANRRYPRRSASFPAVPPAAGRLLPCHPVA